MKKSNDNSLPIFYPFFILLCLNSQEKQKRLSYEGNGINGNNWKDA